MMNRWIIALTVMLPTLIEIVDSSVVNVSLDHIRGSLSAGIDEATWTITSYLVSNAIIIPITGWLSRIFGRKLYLILSISLFTFSSFMCGSAGSLQSLVFFRVLQGLGGGALQPISQAILLETFPPRQRGIAMAIFGFGAMFGPAIGPLLGGWITDNWSWHWIFYINVPIGVISILMVLFFIFDPPYMKRTKMKIDYWGLFFLTVGLGCLQIVLDKGQREDWFSSGLISWMSYISISSLILFVLVELSMENPVVNLKAFKNISFSSGNMIMFFTFSVFFSSVVILPIYLQTLLGYTSSLAGLVLSPAGFATMITMPLAGYLVNKINLKAMIALGIALIAYSVYLMSRFNLTTDFNSIFWPRVLIGLGMGFFFIPIATATVSGIRKEEMGNATGIFNLLRNLGGSVGVAFTTTLLARRMQFHQVRLAEHLTPFDRNFQIAFSQISQWLKGTVIAQSPFNQGTLTVMYSNLIKQASMLSFNDVFFILTIISALLIPFVLLIKKGEQETPPTSMH